MSKYSRYVTFIKPLTEQECDMLRSYVEHTLPSLGKEWNGRNRAALKRAVAKLDIDNTPTRVWKRS